MNILLLIIACITFGFITGYYVRQNSSKPLNLRVSAITADTYTGKEGWTIVEFSPKHPIVIKEGKECVLYLGIKTDA